MSHGRTVGANGTRPSYGSRQGAVSNCRRQRGDMTRLSVTVDAHPHFSVVTLIGDLDKSSAPLLEERLADFMRRGHVCLVVDTTGLGFCDSTGIWVLLTSLRRAYERKGWLRLVGVHGFLGRLLDLTR